MTEVEYYSGSGDYSAKEANYVVQYTYDYNNRLIHRKLDISPSSSTEQIHQTAYVYDGDQIVLQFEKDGTGSLARADLTHRDLWGPAVDQLLAQENVHHETSPDHFVRDDLFWALTDNLNTVRDLATSSGGTTTIAEHRVYDAFGNQTASYKPSNKVTTAVDCVFGYTGKLFDSDTKLQNNLNRWYEAITGKWMSKDPIEDGTNLYRYCDNEPLSNTDPLGLARCPAVDPNGKPPYDDTKLPPNDPNYAKPIIDPKTGKVIGWTYPNEKIGNGFVATCLIDKVTAFYIFTPNGGIVHRCPYPGGINRYEPSKDGGYWGCSQNPKTKELISYLYDPKTDNLRIRVWDKDPNNDPTIPIPGINPKAKILREQTIKCPKQTKDLPWPKDVPAVPK